MLERLSIRTSARTAMIDITSKVQQVVERSGVKSGICTVLFPIPLRELR